MKKILYSACAYFSLAKIWAIAQGPDDQDEYCNKHPNSYMCTLRYAPTGRPTNYPTLEYEYTITDFEESKFFSPDSLSEDYFGHSVAVWEETVLVGAYQTARTSSSYGNKQEHEDIEEIAEGAVFVYENHNRFSTRLTHPQISQGALGTYYGYSVAISNGVTIVGAPRSSDNVENGGAVFIYNQNLDKTWTLAQTITATDRVENHFLGYSVAINGDHIMIGAPGDDHHAAGENAGAVYTYKLFANTWNFVSKLTVTNDNKGEHQGEGGDNFGSAIAISGDYAVLGAFGDNENTGVAYLYVNFGNAWGPVYQLRASDYSEEACFGYSVAINGNNILVGAYNGNGHWYGSGAVYAFLITETTSLYVPQLSKLVAHDGMTGDFFGFSVATYGDLAIVGAHGEEGKDQEDGPPRALSEERKLPGGGQKHQGENCGPGSPPECEQYQGMYSYRGTGAGAAYVFKNSDSKWGQVMKLLPAYSEAYDHFGVSVAVYDVEFVVGADLADGITQDTGAAYVFFPIFGLSTANNKADQNSAGISTASIALFIILVPIALGVVWWIFAPKKIPEGMMPLPQDSNHGSSQGSSHGSSRHGANASWGKPTKFDNSNWGMESTSKHNSVRASKIVSS